MSDSTDHKQLQSLPDPSRLLRYL